MREDIPSRLITRTSEQVLNSFFSHGGFMPTSTQAADHVQSYSIESLSNFFHLWCLFLQLKFPLLRPLDDNFKIILQTESAKTYLNINALLPDNLVLLCTYMENQTIFLTNASVNIDAQTVDIYRAANMYTQINQPRLTISQREEQAVVTPQNIGDWQEHNDPLALTIDEAATQLHQILNTSRFKMDATQCYAVYFTETQEKESKLTQVLTIICNIAKQRIDESSPPSAINYILIILSHILKKLTPKKIKEQFMLHKKNRSLTVELLILCLHFTNASHLISVHFKDFCDQLLRADAVSSDGHVNIYLNEHTQLSKLVNCLSVSSLDPHVTQNILSFIEQLFLVIGPGLTTSLLMLNNFELGKYLLTLRMENCVCPTHGIWQLLDSCIQALSSQEQLYLTPVFVYGLIHELPEKDIITFLNLFNNLNKTELFIVLYFIAASKNNGDFASKLIEIARSLYPTTEDMQPSTSNLCCSQLISRMITTRHENRTLLPVMKINSSAEKIKFIQHIFEHSQVDNILLRTPTTTPQKLLNSEMQLRYDLIYKSVHPQNSFSLLYPKLAYWKYFIDANTSYSDKINKLNQLKQLVVTFSSTTPSEFFNLLCLIQYVEEIPLPKDEKDFKNLREETTDRLLEVFETDPSPILYLFIEAVLEMLGYFINKVLQRKDSNVRLNVEKFEKFIKILLKQTKEQKKSTVLCEKYDQHAASLKQKLTTLETCDPDCDTTRITQCVMHSKVFNELSMWYACKIPMQQQTLSSNSVPVGVPVSLADEGTRCRQGTALK